MGMLLSCKVEQAEIAYGNDACHFCSMTIVDKGHASQYVTKKGKAYKFDAIECMVNELKEIDNSKVELLLVADFNNPGSFISAHEAVFMVHPEIPSPMGEYLSAFSDSSVAKELDVDERGKTYNWNTLELSNK